jgi:hypothetical protein
MQIITKEDLAYKETHVNCLLKKCKLKVAYRYNYVAIDILDKNSGNMKDTLIAGLTKRQAYDILEAISRILLLET